MSQKIKVTLEPGEALVVASLDQLEHVIETYRTLAERIEVQEDRQAWLDLADHFEAWVLDTTYFEEVEDDDWN